MGDEQAPSRADFPRFLSIPTRCDDCDVYVHVNNVVYYSYFDTAVTEHLVREGGLKPMSTPAIGVVVETRCQFRQELNFPDVVDAGIKVTRLCRSSVRYEIGLFRQGEEKPAAYGHFVHVWIDRESRRPESMPEAIRAALQPLLS